MEEATKLYSNANEETGLVYPTYKDAKKKFEKTNRELQSFIKNHPNIDEHTDESVQIEYVKAYQKSMKAFEELITYDEFNDDIQSEKALKDKMSTLENHRGNYENVKAHLKERLTGPEDSATSLSEIEFFSDDNNKMYNIDSSYIDQLLGNYQADNLTIRDEIEKALQKLNKPAHVRMVYQNILDEIDREKNEMKEDIFSLKRNFFSREKNQIIAEFAEEYKVELYELHSSAIQYTAGADEIPNMKNVMNKIDFESYKKEHPEVNPFKYRQMMKSRWKEVLNTEIIPLEDELR
ncbi:type I restriction endonuclease subunit R, EcoR124 family [Macrococcus carouselicus]|uniref:Type I restriction enzyme R protein C-terminal domain-containing protein n=1 Tax=Macrococcus carouselicus TaxID=69969 RepID=A0A9Q8CL35_9STAP|nr:hypothetical protein [Macrococcus carouselicus]TDM02195.1 hypothetical protein ERX40_06460 [Macrococcus carouselicus]